ncbi:MAG: nucleotidyltransferase domain-containing protein [Clostridia bacterium]|nr:nucleotidyltransferase domain-containing protein [Clostridia bacterium]
MVHSKLENQVLKGLVKHLNKTYPGEIYLVQLFGSRARGDARLDSDYDILVVVKDRSIINRSLIYDYILDVNLEYGIDLSLKIYDVEEFELFLEKGVPFIIEIVSKGQRLWIQ